VDSVISEPVATALFRHIHPGFDTIAAGYRRPRHAHLSAYATILLDGTYEQASFAGRMRIEAGDVLIQPVLDRHDSRCLPKCGLRLLRLAWIPEPGLGGVYKVRSIDTVIRTAISDPAAASELLREALRDAVHEPVMQKDWPDLLSAHLRAGGNSLSRWADEHRLARETVSRGFVRTFGVAPRQYAAELRARAAWIRVVTRGDDLALIASELGYADQPHMTRAIRMFTGAPPDTWRRHLRVRLPECYFASVSP
jgi:AraC-like DNA-binding protein